MTTIQNVSTVNILATQIKEYSPLNILKFPWDTHGIGQLTTVLQVRLPTKLKDRGILPNGYYSETVRYRKLIHGREICFRYWQNKKL